MVKVEVKVKIGVRVRVVVRVRVRVGSPALKASTCWSHTRAIGYAVGVRVMLSGLACT